MTNTNPDIHGYSKEKIYDCHCHIEYEYNINQTLELFQETMGHFNYGKIQVCALPSYNRLENYKAFYIKSHISPSVYVSAGLDHHFDERDTADYYLSEIKRYHAMGCDGIKMLEGKMTLHRKIGRRLSDSVFDKFYAYAEENSLPIIMHLGDPLANWDKSKMSQYAIEHGWYCDENDPTREDLRTEVAEVLEKFPNLTLIMAHFYFMGDELERAAAMMDKYKNLHFDLTPGGEMFVEFTKNYDNARAFFEKYSDRLLYGTDTYAWIPDMSPEERNGARINLLRSYLEKTEDFEADSFGMLRPFGLSEEITNKIYRDNFVRLYGDVPKKIDNGLIGSALNEYISETQLNELDAENAKIIADYFESLSK